MIRVKIRPAFRDDRGSIYDILEREVAHVGLVTSKRGSVRANHYHKKSTQYTYILSGKVEYREKDLRIRDSRTSTVILGPGDLVETPPLVAHALRFLRDSTILDMTTRPRRGRGYESDTVRVEV